MLARTSPRPFVEPDIGLLLHGRDRAPGAVSLVWRRERVIELGDALWCLVMTARSAGIRLDDVAAANVAKLGARYPSGYADAASMERHA